jgi:hypothetical protein
MPFVKRDERGAVIAVSQQPGSGFNEELPHTHPAVAAFIAGVGSEAALLEDTDKDLIRVLEDLVDVLTAKGLILFTDLPEEAQQKIMRRQQLRVEMGDALNLIGED